MTSPAWHELASGQMLVLPVCVWHFYMSSPQKKTKKTKNNQHLIASLSNPV